MLADASTPLARGVDLQVTCNIAFAMTCTIPGKGDRKLSVNNWPKLLLILAVVVGIFALLLAGKTELQDVDKYLTLIVGYIIGNGIAAKKEQPVEPVISSKGQHNDYGNSRL